MQTIKPKRMTFRLHLLTIAIVLSAAVFTTADAPKIIRWQRLSPMPVAVFNAAVSTSGPWAVITGGNGQAMQPIAAVQCYHLDEDRWLPPMALRVARDMHAQITLTDGRILVAGGDTYSSEHGWTAIAACEFIDVHRQTVTPAPDLPAPTPPPTAHLLTDGRAVVIGGDLACIFDPNQNEWSAAIELRRPRRNHTSVLLDNNRVLVVGGRDDATIELVDINAARSKLLEIELPHPTDDARAAIDPAGVVWVVGGQNGRTGDTFNRTWKITQPAPNQFELDDGPPLQVEKGVADQCLLATGRYLICAGGESQHAGRDTELTAVRLLHTRRDKVTALPAMQVPHDDAVAVLHNSTLIIFGGFATHTPKAVNIPVPLVHNVVERMQLPW